MTYTVIGIAAIPVIGGLAYLVYWRRVNHSTPVSQEHAPKTIPNPPETISEEASELISDPPEIIAESKKVIPPMVSEFSSLPENAKNKLMNAVWYRCENPDCNYTQFLEVHHIVSEVEGGTNRLDNLIVLCSKCHAAADRHEISEKELQSWIKERTARFKTNIDWPYR